MKAGLDKPDIRWEFTMTALRDSLVALMKEKPVLNISVKEICERAGVGRSTFYTHYKDIYALLKTIQDETLAHFDAMVESQPKGKLTRREIEVRAEKSLEYIVRNCDSIQVLLSENGDLGFQKKFIERLINNEKQTVKRLLDKPVDEKTERAYSVFFVYGAVALLRDWLKNGMDISAGEMTKTLFHLLNGVWR